MKKDFEVVFEFYESYLHFRENVFEDDKPFKYGEFFLIGDAIFDRFYTLDASRKMEEKAKFSNRAYHVVEIFTRPGGILKVVEYFNNFSFLRANLQLFCGEADMKVIGNIVKEYEITNVWINAVNDTFYKTVIPYKNRLIVTNNKNDEILYLLRFDEEMMSYSPSHYAMVKYFRYFYKFFSPLIPLTVVISDYGKGTVTSYLLSEVLNHIYEYGKIGRIYINAKPSVFDKYIDLFNKFGKIFDIVYFLNFSEYLNIWSKFNKFSKNIDEFKHDITDGKFSFLTSLADILGASLVITLSQDGLAYCDKNTLKCYYAPVPKISNNVIGTIGAGDGVISLFSIFDSYFRFDEAALNKFGYEVLMKSIVYILYCIIESMGVVIDTSEIFLKLFDTRPENHLRVLKGNVEYN